MPDFGEMRRTIRLLAARDQGTDLPAVQPMYDE
jgi:hypothetical protein